MLKVYLLKTKKIILLSNRKLVRKVLPKFTFVTNQIIIRFDS